MACRGWYTALLPAEAEEILAIEDAAEVWERLDDLFPAAEADKRILLVDKAWDAMHRVSAAAGWILVTAIRFFNALSLVACSFPMKATGSFPMWNRKWCRASSRKLPGSRKAGFASGSSRWTAIRLKRVLIGIKGLWTMMFSRVSGSISPLSASFIVAPPSGA